MGGYSQQFGQQLLKDLGAPVTQENMKFLAAWAQAEGGHAAYNPFNTTEKWAGATSYNSVGVRNYSSMQDGLQATLATLKNGRYDGILSALKSGTSAMSAAQAVAASPWGTGALVVKVLGGTVQTPPATSTGSTTGSSGAPPNLPQIGVLPDAPAPDPQQSTTGSAVGPSNAAGASIGTDQLPSEGNVAALLYLNHLAAQAGQSDNTQTVGA